MRVCVCVRSSLAHGKSRLMKHLVSSGAMGEAHLATEGPYLSERAQNNAHHHHPPGESLASPPSLPSDPTDLPVVGVPVAPSLPPGSPGCRKQTAAWRSPCCCFITRC